MTETLRPVRQAHRFDEARLAEFLRDHLPGFAPPMTVRQFEGGQSNPTFLLETAGGNFVLRKKPPGTLLPSAHLVEREYRVMTALKDSGVPVPAMRLLCEDAGLIGTSFYVMDHVAGRVFRADVESGAVAVCQRLAMQFRIKDFDNVRGFRRYFWKAAPIDAGK